MSTLAVDATKAVILTATANSGLPNHDTATTVNVITNITYIASYTPAANIATLTTANTTIAAFQDFAFSSTALEAPPMSIYFSTAYLK
jgi:hypothetical protein